MSILETTRTSKGKPIPGTDHWVSVRTIDMHTGGEPLRVILEGYPKLAGNTVLEKRKDALQNHDYFRTSLMFEPRGHADMYGCVLVEPDLADSDFGIIFLHNEGYSTMCGHAIIAISKLVFQMGWKKSNGDQGILRIDAPCGQIISFTTIEAGQPAKVSFHCVPSFIVGLDQSVEVSGMGRVNYDLAFGGAFYAYVDLGKNELDFSLNRSDYESIVDAGKRIKAEVIKQDDQIIHPLEPDLSFLYGTIFIDESTTPDVHSRNVCVFADGEVDRCPTGSGVSGRMAIHAARNEIEIGETLKIESIVGSVFTGSIVKHTTFGNAARRFDAVIPAVSGEAYITGEHTFLIDSNDPLQRGFLLR